MLKINTVYTQVWPGDILSGTYHLECLVKFFAEKEVQKSVSLSNIHAYWEYTAYKSKNN